MVKTVAILALAAGLAACSGAPFAPAASQMTPTSSPYVTPGIPQSQYECMTDEGYGRSMPCDGRD